MWKRNIAAGMFIIIHVIINGLWLRDDYAALGQLAVQTTLTALLVPGFIGYLGEVATAPLIDILAQLGSALMLLCQQLITYLLLLRAFQSIIQLSCREFMNRH